MLNSVLISQVWLVHIVLREDRTEVPSYPFMKVYFSSELVPGR